MHGLCSNIRQKMHEVLGLALNHAANCLKMSEHFWSQKLQPKHLQQKVHKAFCQAIIREVDDTKLLKVDPELMLRLSILGANIFIPETAASNSWSKYYLSAFQINLTQWGYEPPLYLVSNLQQGSAGKECRHSHHPNSNLTESLTTHSFTKL